MEDTEKVDPAFQKAFNDGYFIGWLEPELMEKLSTIKSDSPRVIGLQQGYEQFLKEESKEKLPSWLRGVRTETGKEHISKDLERDRGIETER